METVIENQVAIINNSLEVFKTAPEILTANRERSQKAVAVGNSILIQWQNAWAIENEEERLAALAEADARSNKYLVNCATALKEEKEMRAAITQLMDEFKKMFTACENDIDKTKAGTVTAKVQSNRDDFAAESFKIQERKRKEAEQKAAKAQESIEIKFQMETSFTNQYNDFLLSKKQKLQAMFNALTLADFENDCQAFRSIKFSFNFKCQGPYASNVKYHTNDDLAGFAVEVINAKEPELSANYSAEMSLLHQELIDKLPSKQSELLEQKRLADEAEERRQEQLRLQKEAEEKRQRELAAAKDEAERKAAQEKAERERKEEQERMAKMEREAAEEKQRLERERIQREEEEKRKMEREAEEAKKKAELQAEMTKQADLTLTLFDKEAEIADGTPAPAARQGYNIVVTHQAGFVQIFQFWFENEGKNLAIDKMEKTSLGQMKAFCEKFAHKNDTKIESKFLHYEESFKAINKR